MNEEIPVFRTKTLKRAQSSSEYDLYRAALEWGLIDPIVIQSRQDLKSESRWRDKIEPYHHQVMNLITFCRRLPVTLLADDVGLGKTISAGLIASELISRGRVSKILIVCPKLLMPQWKEELESKFSIPSIAVTGRKLIEAEPPEDVGAVITTYNSARIYMEALAGAGFEMLVLDEAHKLRNLYGVDRPPKVAERFKEVLKERAFKYVLMLTATPIQNRLWDIYSLIDLLTVARGHENPFGKQGIFARKFIADDQSQARHLKPEAKDEFRSIVYGYMSRVRRGDANLHFPERVVRLHRVDPTPEELELLQIIKEPIKKLQYLAQIVILQAFISSPQALQYVLAGMAKNQTAPESLAIEVKEVVSRMKTSAKLNGLSALIDKLRAEQPEQWRVVVFTRWRQTQTTIQIFLEEQGITYGLINGDSGAENQKTIEKFRTDKPEIHVIISTEAGSEGVNLQVANVIVNYDLPWNPMIVEQRIGRVQRLRSAYASVSIFNLVLKGTFEEYIVGRLMEKLQMASHAIGDIESLLEASGLNENETGSNGFEEKILELVLASLNGANVEESTRKAEKSIDDAKIELEREEKNINTMLGGMDGSGEVGPRLPTLPEHPRSMDASSFTLAAFQSLGIEIVEQQNDLYLAKIDGRNELIQLGEKMVESTNAVYYGAGTQPFERLVNRLTSTGLHVVKDIDDNIENRTEKILRNWASNFGGEFHSQKTDKIWVRFEGRALLKTRATVALDSYERLIEVVCSPDEYKVPTKSIIPSRNEFIEDPRVIGMIQESLVGSAQSDTGIAEFCRFYTERRSQEVALAAGDPRKTKKLEDDFTPRLDISLVGLDGSVSRELQIEVTYNVDSGHEYRSTINVIPSTDEIKHQPIMDICSKTQKSVPVDCLAKCEISGKLVLKHLLVRSEISGRQALPEYGVACSLTGKQILMDESEKSSVTGKAVTRSLLKASALSGKLAEPQFIRECEFSLTDVLENETAISQVSGKIYRIDEQVRSAVSGKTGHKQEFIHCSVTDQPLLLQEAEKCEVTNKIVLPGILEVCEVSGKKVLPTELEKSAISGKMALKKYVVSSSLSDARLLEQEAIRSVAGKFCAPLEAKICLWSGRRCHPDDIRTCQLTGIHTHFEYVTTGGVSRLEPLVNLLNGITRRSDQSDLWLKVTEKYSKTNKGEAKVESAESSPDGKHLAVCLEVSTLLGLKKRHAGLLYSVEASEIVGKIATGKRSPEGWRE